MEEDKCPETLSHSVAGGITTQPIGRLANIGQGLAAVQEEDEDLSHRETASIHGAQIPEDELVKSSDQRVVVTISSSRPVSRSGSGRTKTIGPDIVVSQEQGLDSERDGEDEPQNLNQSDIDLLGADSTNDKDWDTDLETEEPSPAYDHTGRTAYLEVCKRLHVVPAAYFLRHMNDYHLSLKHHGVTSEEMKAIAISLASNTSVTTLDLSDNWLGYEGGLAVCVALKENCFITDLNLSDNHLNLCVEQLCSVIKQNSTLAKVTLTGNRFDDLSAGHLADLIMNTSKLECLNLSHNKLGEVAGQVLGPAISENLCLKELDLSWNHLRRKGAMAVAAGIKNNVYMKRVNLSWNGFGIEGSLALFDALKSNHVLEEIDIANNRITTEGAVLIGKALAINESLKVFKIGKNPLQSSGCWAITSAILKNPNCALKTLDFSDIPVNDDFLELWKQAEEQLPELQVTHGGAEGTARNTQGVHPVDRIRYYISKHNKQVSDFFGHFDKNNNMTITREEFRDGLKLLCQSTKLNLTDNDVKILLEELDADGSGKISYRELELKRISRSRPASMKIQRSVTS